MSDLADVSLDFGSRVLNLVLQQGIIHHLLQLVPDGVAQVSGRPSICKMVVPACKHDSREGKQLVAANKPCVTIALHLVPCSQFM